MLTSETKRRIDSCRDILVGKLPQPLYQVEPMNHMACVKLCDFKEQALPSLIPRSLAKIQPVLDGMYRIMHNPATYG